MKHNTCNNITVVQKRPFWKSLFTGADGKMAVVGVAFLIWTTAVTVGWIVTSLKNGKLDDLPPTVVHLTLALGATKVTHRLAEGNWEKVISQIIDLFNKRKRK